MVDFGTRWRPAGTQLAPKIAQVASKWRLKNSPLVLMRLSFYRVAPKVPFLAFLGALLVDLGCIWDVFSVFIARCLIEFSSTTRKSIGHHLTRFLIELSLISVPNLQKICHDFAKICQESTKNQLVNDCINTPSSHTAALSSIRGPRPPRPKRGGGGDWPLATFNE